MTDVSITITLGSEDLDRLKTSLGPNADLDRIQDSWHGRTKPWEHIANLTALGSWCGGISLRCGARRSWPTCGLPSLQP